MSMRLSRIDLFLMKVYRVLLRNTSFSPPAQLVSKNDDQANFTYVTLCGVHHYDMLRESLLSVARSWTSLPSFIIYSDGSMSCEDIEAKFSWLGKRLSVLSWEDTLNEFDPVNEKDIIDYANLHVMGKKFAIILSNGRKQPTFWCDSDVLWYSDFFIDYNEDDFFMKGSADCEMSYSKNLVDLYPSLLQPPYVCAGIVFISGDMMKKVNLTSMLKQAISSPDHFSEQTMVARTVLESGANIWDPNEIACVITDVRSVMPTFIKKKWIARHYVSPVRHLFWRDAFSLRVGLKP